jgi:hypothetical protein
MVWFDTFKHKSGSFMLFTPRQLTIVLARTRRSTQLATRISSLSPAGENVWGEWSSSSIFWCNSIYIWKWEYRQISSRWQVNSRGLEEQLAPGFKLEDVTTNPADTVTRSRIVLEHKTFLYNGFCATRRKDDKHRAIINIREQYFLAKDVWLTSHTRFYKKMIDSRHKENW